MPERAPTGKLPRSIEVVISHDLVTSGTGQEATVTKIHGEEKYMTPSAGQETTVASSRGEGHP